jgi:hypothetical protein
MGFRSRGINPLHLIDMMTQRGFTVFNLGQRAIGREKMVRFIELGNTNPAISTALIFRNL